MNTEDVQSSDSFKEKMVLLLESQLDQILLMIAEINSERAEVLANKIESRPRGVSRD